MNKQVPDKNSRPGSGETMEKIKDLIYKYGVVPVLVIDDSAKAIPLAQALVKGELEVAEITFRTDAAEDSIKQIVREVPDMLVGAGTVLNRAQGQRALDAGANFIVSPGLDEDLANFCREKNILYIPGCSSASDVQKAINLGINTVKFFPAESSGGVKALSALAAAFNQVRFLPTGGITPEKFSEYLRKPFVIAVGSSWIAPKNLLEKGDFASIEKRAKDAVFAVLNFKFSHMGINCETEQEGYGNMFKLADMFNLEMGDTKSSSYVGREVEITKMPFQVRGPHGHLGYYADNLERAIFYLEKKGIEFDHEHVKPYKGKPYVIYLKDQIAGFAIHIEERNDHNPPAWEHRDIIKERIGWTDGGIK